MRMQVIALTEELLESAKQNEKSSMITGTSDHFMLQILLLIVAERKKKIGHINHADK